MYKKYNTEICKIFTTNYVYIHKVSLYLYAINNFCMFIAVTMYHFN